MTASESAPSKAPWWRFAPLLIFAALGALFAYRLLSEDAPTFLIDRPAPEIALLSLEQALASTEGAPEPAPAFTSESFADDSVVIVNFWASWCVPCRVEHPDLMRLAARDDVVVYGVAQGDEPSDSRAFLAELGDPFEAVGVDRNGRAGLQWGVRGLPETFVINRAGRVIYKHTGPIQNDDLTRFIIPAIEAAQE